MHINPVEALWWITLGKVAIGSILFVIVVASLYRFKAMSVTIMGLLLLLNVFCLFLIASLT